MNRPKTPMLFCAKRTMRTMRFFDKTRLTTAETDARYKIRTVPLYDLIILIISERTSDFTWIKSYADGKERKESIMKKAWEWDYEFFQEADTVTTENETESETEGGSSDVSDVGEDLEG